MSRICLILSLPAMLLLGGCFNVKAQGPDIDLGGGDSASNAAAASANDTRSASQIQADNARLRTRLAKLETDYKAWTAAVDARKAEIKDMERQYSDTKKDRDRWKKAAKD